MRIDCREFQTNVPEAGDAPPADPHQGGGFVRIGEGIKWQWDIDANCHSIYNLRNINCIPVKNFVTKDDLKEFAHFDDINAGYNAYIKRHYPEITISAYPTGHDGEIQFAKNGYPEEPHTRFEASEHLKWNSEHNRLEVEGNIYLNGNPIGGPAGQNYWIQWYNDGKFGASQKLTWDDSYSNLTIAGNNYAYLTFDSISYSRNAYFYWRPDAVELSLTVFNGGGTFIVDSFTSEVIRRTYMSLREGEIDSRFSKPGFIPDYMLMLANGESYLSFCSNVGPGPNYPPQGSWIQAHDWYGAQPLSLQPFGGSVAIRTAPPDTPALAVGGSIVVTGYLGNSSMEGLHLIYNYWPGLSTIYGAGGQGLRLAAFGGLVGVGMGSWHPPTIPYPNAVGGAEFHFVVGDFQSQFYSFIDIAGQYGIAHNNFIFGGITFSNTSIDSTDMRVSVINGGAISDTGPPDMGFIGFQTRGSDGLQERVRIDSQGRVRIVGSSNWPSLAGNYPPANLSVATGGAAEFAITVGGTDGAAIQVRNGWLTDTPYALRLNPLGGDVLIGPALTFSYNAGGGTTWINSPSNIFFICGGIQFFNGVDASPQLELNWSGVVLRVPNFTDDDDAFGGGLPQDHVYVDDDGFVKVMKKDTARAAVKSAKKAKK